MLNDLLTPNLSLVFCGTAAGTTSAKRGQYYAGKGNKFWRTLFETGLTLRQLDPSEYQLLLTFGIGLTDIVKGQSGMDNAIDFRRASRESFWEKILRCRPGILCFNGKKAAQAFLGGSRQTSAYSPWLSVSLGYSLPHPQVALRADIGIFRFGRISLIC